MTGVRDKTAVQKKKLHKAGAQALKRIHQF
jgi:hypothetical protein